MPQIRQATERDILELVRLRIDFLTEMNAAEHHAPLPDGFEAVLIGYLESAIPNGNFVAYVAQEDEKIIATSGICFYQAVPSQSNPTGRIAYIMNMYTVPCQRKKGLATALLQRTIQEARLRGSTTITLHATEDGRNLYAKTGFSKDEDGMFLHL